MKVKTRTTTFFVAYDGREFDTATECLEYETGTDAGVRCTLGKISAERQSAKNELRGLEHSIVYQKDKARNLVHHKKFMKGCAVTEMASKYLAQLAINMKRRDELRAKLRGLHERQGQLRSLLDKNRGRNQ